jgi:hypothetical protein
MPDFGDFLKRGLIGKMPNMLETIVFGQKRVKSRAFGPAIILIEEDNDKYC